MKKFTYRGFLLKRGERYYYKYKLPGTVKYVTRALLPEGAVFATTDLETAKYLAQVVWDNELKRQELGNVFEGNLKTLAKIYIEFAKGYYPAETSSEASNVELSMRALIKSEFALNNACDFGPRKLKRVRQQMVDCGRLCRREINRRVNVIRRMFKWAVSEEMVPSSVYESLRTVEALKKGRTKAIDHEPVRPVPVEDVQATLQYVSPVISTMVQVQLLTGMRPGELVIMRPIDIEKSCEGFDGVWIYRPTDKKTGDHKHKTAYLGKKREIYLGPEAQRLLKPYMNRDPQDYMFKPVESIKAVKKKMTGGYERLRESYMSDTYRKAIRYGVLQAMDDGKIDKPWTPYQLRHTAATRAEREFDIKTASAMLGHSSISTTLIYVEQDMTLAAKLAKRIG
ncbi:MAG: site-specific integrase [Phycisphaerae bacterium]|nr:site-specific integrase [Phycisphaerae bacterium]